MLGRNRSKQTPFVRHALEHMTAALFERQSRACHEVANRL